MRLQKWMADCGVASRRKSEEIIKSGRVAVNGEIVTEMGTKVSPGKDEVTVDGKSIGKEEDIKYILLNKPFGVITSVSDPRGRKTVIDFVDHIDERIYPVGRLDYDSAGLLLLTNDGDLAYKLTHPKFEVPKTYIAKVEGIPSEEELEKLRNGIEIEDYVTSPAQAALIDSFHEESILEIIIHEGRNRQVRKMCEAISHPVKELTRISFGPIELGNLQRGESRELTNAEINALENATII